MTNAEIRDKLAGKGLKVTPQRVAVLEALDVLHNHPSVDQIIEYIRRNHPNIATGTVYKVLDTLTAQKIINRIKTDKDVMRYDADIMKHHHIFSSDSGMITDYYDDKLTGMLHEYFKKNKIPGLEIEDIQLHIIGRSEYHEKC